MKNLLYTFLIAAFIVACNTSKPAERIQGRITEATLDSIMVYYLDELEKGEDMVNLTNRQYAVLDSVEKVLMSEIETCLDDEKRAYFQKDQEDWMKEWEFVQDSVQKANEDVIFEDNEEEKEMFLTWQYTYFKELRIIQLLEIRDEFCEQ